MKQNSIIPFQSLQFTTNSEIDKLMVKTGLNEKQINNWLSQRMERSGDRLPSSKVLPSTSASTAGSNDMDWSDPSGPSSSQSQFSISGPTPSKKRCVEGMIRSPSKAQRKLDPAAFEEKSTGNAENRPPTSSSKDDPSGWTSRAGGLRPVARFRPKAGGAGAASGSPAADKAAAEAKKNENKLVFRVESSDGFFMESENVDEAWINITAKIQWGEFLDRVLTYVT